MPQAFSGGPECRPVKAWRIKAHRRFAPVHFRHQGGLPLMQLH